jgi:3-oxoacyl-[acyl-carrier-protein] synthase-3
MLDEFLREGRARAGEKMLCMVPESGRFNTAYMQLTVVES